MWFIIKDIFMLLHNISYSKAQMIKNTWFQSLDDPSQEPSSSSWEVYVLFKGKRNIFILSTDVPLAIFGENFGCCGQARSLTWPIIELKYLSCFQILG